MSKKKGKDVEIGQPIRIPQEYVAILNQIRKTKNAMEFAWDNLIRAEAAIQQLGIKEQQKKEVSQKEKKVEK